MRLIDADRLKERVLKWLPSDPCGIGEKEHPIETDIVVSLIMEIEGAPTVSAELKTGHWYIREYEYFTCSECGEDYWNSCDSTAEAKELLETGDYPNYCPNCGCRMEGK